MSYEETLKRKKEEIKKQQKNKEMQEQLNNNTKNKQEIDMQNVNEDTNLSEEEISPPPPPPEQNQENKTYEQLVSELIDPDNLQKLLNSGISFVPTAQLEKLMETNTQLMSDIQQHEKTKFRLAVAKDQVKELRRLAKNYFQMEAITLASKEALSAILKCFEGANQGLQGWPTLQVFTPEGWVKGSVDYNIHNAVLLARSATTSENLAVVEKHIRGFTGKINALNQDVSDLQAFIGFKVEKCSHCSRFKKVNSKCHHCGKSDSDGMEFLDEDDEE